MQDYEEKEGFFANLFDKVWNFFAREGYSDRYEEEDYGEAEFEDFPPPRRKWSLRLHSRKDIPIYRKELSNFDNEVEEPAYRLRQGFVVIVNLEKASDEAARRTIDFLSGVAFGIRGSYEKIGEKVFLFAPPGYSIY